MPSRSTETYYSTNPSDCGDDRYLFAELDKLVGDLDMGIDPQPDLPECQNTSGGSDGLPRSEFAELSKRESDFDNPVNQKRYVSRYRDAQTVRQIRALHEMPSPARDATLLVSKPLFSLPSLPPHKLTRFKPWWHESMLPSLPTPARQYRKPAPWRDTSDELKVTFRHLALKTVGPVYAISLNLSPEVEAQARAQDYHLGWLHDRVAHHLKQALDRSVQFQLVMEEVGSAHRLHLHGELQLTAKELPAARCGLKKAGGRWDAEAAQKQLKLAPEPDAGWLNYLVSDLWRVGLTRTVLSRIAPDARLTKSAITFAGSAISSTELLNGKARKIYEAHRVRILPLRAPSR